jgi:hypothetical protein
MEATNNANNASVLTCPIETPNKIMDKLYLGNYLDAENFDKLLALNIKYVLVAGNNLDTNFKDVY